MASEKFQQLLIRVMMAVMQAVWQWFVDSKTGQEPKETEREEEPQTPRSEE